MECRARPLQAWLLFLIGNLIELTPLLRKSSLSIIPDGKLSLAMATTGLPISNKVLRWARVSAGLKLDEAAEKLKVGTEDLAKWEEQGKDKPGVTVLRKMATVYRRAPTVFLLPSPPEEKPLPKDFRTVGGAPHRLTPEVLFAIRDAERSRAEIAELLEEDSSLLDIKQIGRATLNDSPEQHAAIERRRLGVSLEEQLSWARGEVFNRWRNSVEALGVLVFLKKMSGNDCLGFSLFEDGGLATIVVSSDSESEEKRSFTLFHEYAHLLLKQQGICADFGHSRGVVEPWCNKFAGSMLIPAKIIKKVRPNLDMTKEHQWDFEEITELARKLRVSRQALAIRLQDLKLAPSTLYGDVEQGLELERGNQKPKAKRNLIIPQHIKAISASGKATASVVIGALDKGSIDAIEASSILNVSSRYFGGLRKLLMHGIRGV